MIALRPYQNKLYNLVLESFRTNQNTLLQLQTGGGKTAIMSHFTKNANAATLIIAHRQELITQISQALSNNEVKHGVIAPQPVVTECVRQCTKVNYINQSSLIRVASVQTLMQRIKKNDRSLLEFLGKVRYCLIDEAAHVLSDNTWGKAFALLPNNCQAFGLTATPLRADGKGIGRSSKGIFDNLIIGPSVHDLQSQGFLCEYKAFSHNLDIKAEYLKKAPSGDYNPQQLAKGTAEAYILNDSVGHYKKHANNTKTIVFTPDISLAQTVAAEFNAAGYSAAAISGKNSTHERQQIIKDFKSDTIKILVNCEILTEGTDVPDIQTIIMLRATASLSLYRQMIGRVLRPHPSKPHAIILDMVGNIERHLLPCTPIKWSLDGVIKKNKESSDPALSLQSCRKCAFIFSKVLKSCPDCGYKKEYTPRERTAVESVDGDLTELDLSTIQDLKSRVIDIDADFELDHKFTYAPPIAGIMARKRHERTVETQSRLREEMAKWGAKQKHHGGERYRMFYLLFGIDVLSAQALEYKDAQQLLERIASENERT